uniref:Uncharacterized protein n=1 Tax=Setaria italica TaxID=4555 RepID=K4A3D0_SETIT
MWTCLSLCLLDCIGSAFNARGLMQCPNCRNIEDGNWLNPNVLQPSTDSPWARIALADFPFYHCTAGLEGDQTAELSNVQVFDGTEPRNSEIEQHNIGILPMVDPANRLTTPFGFDVPRYDGNNQRRSTQSTTRSRSSSVAPLGSSPAVTSVGHGHGLRGQVVQETAPPATRSSANVQNSNIPNQDARPVDVLISHSMPLGPGGDQVQGWALSVLYTIKHHIAASLAENDYQPLPSDRIHSLL